MLASTQNEMRAATALFIVGGFALANSGCRNLKRERSKQKELTSTVASVNGPSKKAKTFLSERISLPRDTHFGALVSCSPELRAAAGLHDVRGA